MGRIAAARGVRAAAGPTFERILDVESYPDWLIAIERVELLSGDSGAVGSVYRFCIRVGPVREHEDFELRSIDHEARRVTLAKAGSGKPITIDITVRERDAKCEVELDARHEFVGKFLGLPVTGMLFRGVVLGILDQSAPRLAAAVARRRVGAEG